MAEARHREQFGNALHDPDRDRLKEVQMRVVGRYRHGGPHRSGVWKGQDTGLATGAVGVRDNARTGTTQIAQEGRRRARPARAVHARTTGAGLRPPRARARPRRVRRRRRSGPADPRPPSASLSHQIIGRFDVDQLHDYRARRPAMIFDADHWESYADPELLLYAMTDAAGSGFLLLTGPEPDVQWERYIAAVISLIEHFDVRLTIGLNAIPMAVPHTRPVGITSHASRQGSSPTTSRGYSACRCRPAPGTCSSSGSPNAASTPSGSPHMYPTTSHSRSFPTPPNAWSAQSRSRGLGAADRRTARRRDGREIRSTSRSPTHRRRWRWSAHSSSSTTPSCAAEAAICWPPARAICPLPTSSAPNSNGSSPTTRNGSATTARN